MLSLSIQTCCFPLRIWAFLGIASLASPSLHAQETKVDSQSNSVSSKLEVKEETREARAADLVSLPSSVVYSFESTSAPRPLKIHRLQIDLQSPEIELAVGVGEDPDADGPVEALLTPTRELAIAEKMIAAVNCNAWTMFPDPVTGKSPGYVLDGKADIKGWTLIAPSQKRSDPEEGYWSFWIDGEGAGHIGPSWAQTKEMGEARRSAKLAVSGFRGILGEGKPLVEASNVLHPRTAIGLSQDKRQLTLLVVDGRQAKVSEGMSELELAEKLRDCGCWDGMNLDGGGSSAMVVRQNKGELRIMNRPSDVIGARPVPVALGVRLKP